ncbi:hypothetical protein JCM3770_001183 [Rhodotorula araucariae]
MLYRDWDRFRQACEDLCRDSDTPTRACIRWRHQAGLLVLKHTDRTAKQCLTFRTRSSTYLNRFDALNRALLRQYQNKRRPSPRVDGAEASATSLGAAHPGAGGTPQSMGGEPSDDVAAKAKKRRSKKKAK